MAGDLYTVLNVARSATQAEIKKAYRDIARKYHPDKNPGDAAAEEVFKNAAEAYRVLGDGELRAQYDRYGRAGGPAPTTSTEPEAAGDIFNEIFGTRPRGEPRDPPRPKRPSQSPPPRERRGPTSHGGDLGHDLRYTLDLRFEEAAFGTTRDISVPRRARCPACAGTGARAGSAPQLCTTCSGRGNIQREQGFFSSTEICPDCDGRRRRVMEKCGECEGSGEVRIPESVRVAVPPGVDTGTRLKIRGAGDHSARGNKVGDLFVIIDVQADPFFSREGNDVIVEVPVRFTDAALGATIEVPTLEGKVRMRIPPGSQSGRVFRLKSKGIPSPSGQGRGDQRVRIVVEVPAQLTEAQRGLLERLADIEDERPDQNPLVRDFEAAMNRRYGS